MALAPGTRLGVYEVTTQVGAGGMGEVYRARDGKLNRDVALKILPELFAADPDRRARFAREAQTLASLNHPHIGGIYGLEEANGVTALVLELVEGPTLEDRIAQGAIPVEEALKIAAQIADALDAAHEKSIIHRDLKPANIKLTTDDRVKVLDFGLAKAMADDVAQGVSPAVSQSPTMLASVAGVIVGTAAYMSPEQAKGKVVDKRADIWAFGCVLYEMLTGTRAFTGDDVTDFIVSVMTREPDWSRLPKATTPRVLEIVQRCLKKDPRDRLRDIGDVRVEIEDLRATREGSTLGRPRSNAPVLLSTMLPWAVTAVVIIAAVIAVMWGVRREGVTSLVPAHLIVELPSGVILPTDSEHSVLALSPDGTRLVFVGEERGTRRLYLRNLADPVARPIAGTEHATDPFFSPDGNWITFFSEGRINKVGVNGGAPLAIHAATPATVNRGATWIATDSLVYAASANSGLSQGSTVGEQVRGHDDWTYITADTNAPYAWPSALPGGENILFTDVGETPDQSRVNVLSIADKRVTTLVRGATYPRYSATGHLMFVRGGALYSMQFDTRRSQTTASETKVVDGVMVEPKGAAHYAVSATGTLAYVAGPVLARQHELVWVDRVGHVVTVRDDGREVSFPRLSPEGSRLAVTSPTGSNDDVWILDQRRGSLQRVTTAPGEDFEPVWHPDGTRLAISSERDDEEGPGLAWTIGPEFRLEFLLRTPGIGNWEFPTSWSPDGKWLAFTRDRVGATSDVEMLPTIGDRTPVPFGDSAASEVGAMFSPQNSFVAYVSDVSGREEVYVRPFPGPGAAIPISTNGGIEPVWNRNGGELFYREGDALKSVNLSTSGTLERGVPTTVFEGRYERAPYGGRSANYDVSLDGQRFLMVRRKNLPRPTTIHVLLNWPTAIKGLRAP